MFDKLYLLRHGRTVAHDQRYVAGRNDVDLVPLGVEQATKAGTFFRNVSVDGAYVSPLRRTRQTWDALEIALEPVYDDRLMEMDFGDVNGMAYEKVPLEYDDSNLYANPDFCFPNGECVNDVRNRVRSFIDDVLAKTKGDIVVVGHDFCLHILVEQLRPEGVVWDLPEFFDVGDIWKIETGKLAKVFSAQD